MIKFTQFSAVILLILFSGFQCERESVTALNIIEGTVISCSGQPITEVIVLQDASGTALAVDTVYPDDQGFFLHQFTSITRMYYLVPATNTCSSVWLELETGKKSEVTLRQTPIFDALNLTIDLEPAIVDSVRFRIFGARDVNDNSGSIIYRDPQNFDSGITTQWDTLSKIYRLGEERTYFLNTEIYRKGSSTVFKNETISIQKQPIFRTISL